MRSLAALLALIFFGFPARAEIEQAKVALPRGCARVAAVSASQARRPLMTCDDLLTNEYLK
ncbi:MAG TPA: hypothetical protein VGL83_01855 [Stellaceae bacterium]|jgi:hypothetical protein